MRKSHLTIAIVLLTMVLLAGCSPAAKQGTLQFYANGEDFVRQGFISKDGWAITFDHVYITLTDIAAYQTSPPYDPHSGGDIKSKEKVDLGSTYTVDLAEGGEDAPPILVGEVSDAVVGQYNAISWKMARATGGLASDYSLITIGTAQKDDQTVDFTIKVETEYTYGCGEYVGDERKGILDEDGKADLEMTFHFDHIFGDADTPLDDELNLGAPGFEPFAGIAEGGKLDADMAALRAKLPADDYQVLVDTLLTLGHVGEGHCHCGTQ